MLLKTNKGTKIYNMKRTRDPAITQLLRVEWYCLQLRRLWV